MRCLKILQSAKDASVYNLPVHEGKKREIKTRTPGD